MRRKTRVSHLRGFYAGVVVPSATVTKNFLMKFCYLHFTLTHLRRISQLHWMIWKYTDTFWMIQLNHSVYLTKKKKCYFRIQYTAAPCLWSQAQYCNMFRDCGSFHGRVLSCFPVCCSAWISWRSVSLWTVTIPSCWLSPQNQYPCRSNTPPASDEMRFEQRRTRGTFRPAQRRSMARSSKPAGGQERNTKIFQTIQIDKEITKINKRIKN